MLSLLRRIALHAAYPESGDGDGRLTTIAARELFALAVMLDATTDAARVFQLEASANLSALCKRLPALVAAVVDEAASRVPQLVGDGGAAARVLALVAALPFADAAVDASLLGTILELLGLGASSATGGSALGHGGLGGALAALSPASKPDAASAAAAASPAGADSRLLALALDPGERGGGGGAGDPTRGLGSPARALRAKIGCAILERVRWEGAPPQIREHGLLLLLACRARAGRRWWWTQLLGPVGAALCTAPLDEDVFTELMGAHAAAPLGAEPLPGALAAVQCMLLVAEAERRRAAAAGSSGANGGGGDDRSRHGGSPLVELGTQFHLWQRLGMLMEVGASERHLEVRDSDASNRTPRFTPRARDVTAHIPRHPPPCIRLAQVRDASRRLLEKVLGALALSPHELPSALPSLLASYMGLAAPHVQALRATMLNTLAQANGAKAHVGWLTLWAGALAPQVATHDGAASLYDTLVHAVFGAAALSVGDSPVVPALMGCRLARRHVVGFVAAKRPWLALAAALALSPQLPMDAPSSEEALEPLAAAHLATKVAADGGSKVAAALGSMVGRRTYGNLSEDKKAVLLDAQTPDATSTSGGGSSQLVSSADAAWGIASPSALTTPGGGDADGGGGAAEYSAMGGGGGGGGRLRESTLATSALANCALGVLMQVALALDVDVRALLFWERFFVLYFAALRVDPGFFPGAKQAELTEHFSRTAKAFEGSDRRVYMLYECFTTWSDEVIPKRGAFFTPGSINAEGHEHFISIVTAAHPAPLGRVAAVAVSGEDVGGAPAVMAAETVDDGADLAGGLQPLQLGGSGVAVGGMDSDDDVDDAEAAAVATERPNLKQLIDSGAEAWGHADASDVLRQLLPPRKPPPTDADLMLDGHETQEAIDAKLRELQAALVQRVKAQAAAGGSGAVTDGTGGGGIGGGGGTAAAWEDLGLSSAHFRGCVGALRLADSEYLELVKRLNVNSRSSETQRVMVRHPECEQPVLFVVPQVSVQPGPPEVRERLQANRQRFIGVHSPALCSRRRPRISIGGRAAVPTV